MAHCAGTLSGDEDEDEDVYSGVDDNDKIISV